MTREDLRAFWGRHQRGRGSRQLFPEGGKGTQVATSDLATYAINKASAIACRLDGRINAAMSYEDFADRVYQGLPAWARW